MSVGHVRGRSDVDPGRHPEADKTRTAVRDALER